MDYIAIRRLEAVQSLDASDHYFARSTRLLAHVHDSRDLRVSVPFFLTALRSQVCRNVLETFPRKIMLGRELQKGCGLHLDPLILAVTNLLCGVFGFPW